MEVKKGEGDLEKILKALGIPTGYRPKPSIDTLHWITSRLYADIPYQNYELHLKERAPLAIDVPAVVQRMIVEKKGGLCYEFCVLCQFLLESLGFQVDFVEVFVLTPG